MTACIQHAHQSVCTFVCLQTLGTAWTSCKADRYSDGDSQTGYHHRSHKLISASWLSTACSAVRSRATRSNRLIGFCIRPICSRTHSTLPPPSADTACARQTAGLASSKPRGCQLIQVLRAYRSTGRRAYRDEVEQQDLRSRPAPAPQSCIILPDHTSLQNAHQLNDLLQGSDLQ